MSPNLDGSCNWYEKIEIMTRFKKRTFKFQRTSLLYKFYKLRTFKTFVSQHTSGLHSISHILNMKLEVDDSCRSSAKTRLHFGPFMAVQPMYQKGQRTL